MEMPMMHKTFRMLLAAAVPLGLAACAVDDSGDADTAAVAQQPVPPAPMPMPAPDMTAPVSDMRLEVDLASRQVTLFRGTEQVTTYPVAVGSAEWPTKTGEWKITQVVWNPEWIPPTDESWAEDEERKAPGAADNPLGRVQLVYDPPRTIHGTNEPASIGKAVSHGSIRMRNDDAIALAKRLMESAGVGKDEAWYTQVQQNRTEKQIVDLPGGVPITVK
jgi:lipoprotein-anchoring transpeptidase ErfK/SrfK